MAKYKVKMEFIVRNEDMKDVNAFMNNEVAELHKKLNDKFKENFGKKAGILYSVRTVK